PYLEIKSQTARAPSLYSVSAADSRFHSRGDDVVIRFEERGGIHYAEPILARHIAGPVIVSEIYSAAGILKSCALLTRRSRGYRDCRSNSHRQSRRLDETTFNGRLSACHTFLRVPAN